MKHVFAFLCFFSGSFGSLITAYKVESSLEGNTPVPRTNGFVTTDYCQTQNEDNQYGIVEIKDNIDQVFVSSAVLFLNF